MFKKEIIKFTQTNYKVLKTTKKKVQNTTITYKKTTKTNEKIIINNLAGNKKSQNSLVVGRTPVEKLQTSY